MPSSLRWIAIFTLGMVLAAPALADEDEGRDPAVRLIDFEIKDQFDNEHRDEDYAGQIVCLIGSDKDGSSFNRLWGQAIEDSLAADPGEAGKQVVYLRVAHMKGVPFFLKGMIKGKLPKEEHLWILTDWKGEFSQAYAFAQKESNVIVFDREGRRVAQAHGQEPDARQMEIVLEALRDLLRE